MRKWWIITLVVGAGGAVLLFLHYTPELVSLASRGALNGSAQEEGERALLEELGRESRRRALEDEPGTAQVALPGDLGTPTGAKELGEFVTWMRSLDHDELLRLSNAKFGFEKSELVERLQALQGEWVVPALGDLAASEADPLLKAILVEGLVGSFASERIDDPRLLPILDTLMAGMKDRSGDPYEVAPSLATAVYGACAGGQGDYMLLMSGYLATSDNPMFLAHGYMYMGLLPGGESALEGMLTGHANENGRFGALEGLRQAATAGRISPERITSLGLSALETETNERNRLLLYEMMISKGGESALSAVEDALRAGETADMDKTAGLLAMQMEPARARALFEDLLRQPELSAGGKQALYDAMGLLKGEEGADFLLDLARNDELDGPERLAGLRGLWSRPVDERLAGELRDVFDTSRDGVLRTEALRMLAYGESAGAGVDLREIAALDGDPAVRAEAVQLAAMQPSADAREWLEQRLFQDSSLDVKAAALGALVYQAHYTGDGDAVLGYLERARKFTDDEGALAMIAEGERMVKDYDPRSLELGLAEEAEFWGKVAKYTDGPASRSFQRQAKQLGQIVASLRATRDGRRPAR